MSRAVRRTSPPARHRPHVPPARRASSTTRAAAGVLLLGLLLGLFAPPVAATRPATRDETSWTPGSGLPMSLSIDSVDPVTLRPNRPVTVSGTLTNNSDRTWTQVEASLWTTTTPASERLGLATLTSSPRTQPQGSQVIDHSEPLGSIGPGTSRRFSVTVPYAALNLGDGAGAQAGVYPVSLAVDATYGPLHRLVAADRTLLSLPPEDTSIAHPVSSALLIPVSAPIARRPNGDFTDEELGRMLSGGRLRHVVDFATAAPSGTLTLAVDPALVQAARVMARGYRVRGDDTSRSTPGEFQTQARQWLDDLTDATAAQQVVLLPWGTPDLHGLTTNKLGQVLHGAVTASRDFGRRYSPLAGSDVVAWQPDAATSRRTLRLSHRNGAALSVVSTPRLPDLEDAADPNAYPSSRLALRDHGATLPVVAASPVIAGSLLTPDTTPLELRQALLAEGTIRAMTDDSPRVRVFALPFDWDPGTDAGGTDMSTGFSGSLVGAVDLDEVQAEPATPYDGRVKRSTGPMLSTSQVGQLRTYRRMGRRVLDMLADPGNGDMRLRQELALGASAWWVRRPAAGQATVEQLVQRAQGQLSQVTVEVPSFVTQSSASGAFPISVSNDLDVPVHVSLSLVPDTQGMEFSVPRSVQLRPGQRRDISVSTHTEGSGLVTVKVWLVTPHGYRVSGDKHLQVRSTQIGLVIWVLMGTGLTVLVGAAAVRLFRRIRRHEMTPRQEPGGA